jgi:DNA-binding transcriptional regulator GbsR (MarR family)
LDSQSLAACHSFYLIDTLFKDFERSKLMPSALSARLAEVERQFVDLWGTMSSLWGINPTMARIHGLLYITGEALTMDDMMARLGISRGNVSMNLTKLTEWGLVQRAHHRGDRKDRYASISDVWEMFTRVAAQRKRRELDPVLTTLRRCRDSLSTEGLGAAAKKPAAKERYRRVDELMSFLQLMDHLATEFLESHKSLKAAVKRLSGQ